MPARHTWPALSNWFTACFTTASRSASAKATNGDLPPSSSETGVRFAAAACATSLPVSIDPVNAMRSTPGCRVSAAPASSPIPWSTLNAPSGSPASRAMSASREAVSGAHSGGFSTTAFPAASAGATRHVASMSGAFHGVITTVTPEGSHSVRLRKPSISKDSSSPPSWSAKNRKFRATRGITELRIERSSEPLSRVSTAASSGTRSSTRSAIPCRISARRFGVVAPQTSAPARAACTARSASSTVPRATRASTLSSIGERSSNVAEDADALAADPVLGRDLDALDRGGHSVPNGRAGLERLSSALRGGRPHIGMTPCDPWKPAAPRTCRSGPTTFAPLASASAIACAEPQCSISNPARSDVPGRITLKLELFQHTGSFKLRGALQPDAHGRGAGRRRDRGVGRQLRSRRRLCRS